MRAHIAFLLRRPALAALLASLIVSALQVTPVQAAGILVNSSTDVVSGSDGKCTLREAITAAVSDQPSGAAPGECAAGSSGVDNISFAGNYVITVNSQLPAVSAAVSISGQGAANTILQAAASPGVANWRVFHVTSTGSLALQQVTVRNGRCIESCDTTGGIEPDRGGGIYNSGTLTITDSSLSGNSAGTFGTGGAIYNTGTLTVTGSLFSSNQGGEGLGGGIHNRGAMTVTNSTFSDNAGGGIHNSHLNGTGSVTDSTFSANDSYDGGGGISNGGTLAVSGSTFSANKGGDGGGGGIANWSLGNLTLTNSTLSGNEAYGGGGIYNTGTLVSTNNTIAGNNAYSYGGGIANSSLGTSTLINTIVSGSTKGNCDGSIVNGGGNLDSAATCGWGYSDGSLSNADPKLGPLASHGGSTQTLALLAGSPAINAAKDALCPSTDQRGLSRPQGSHCDMGAYEYKTGLQYITVNIGGQERGAYWLGLGESLRRSYDGVDEGPVRVFSSSANSEPIIASERINLRRNDAFSSYSEVMGLPASKLSDTYVFPWYNNTGLLDSQLRLANVGETSTEVAVRIGDVDLPTYTLAPNESIRVSAPVVNDGPVLIHSSNAVPIVAALRINLKSSPAFSSYSEILGLSASDVPSTRYIFPWYNNTGLLDSQLRFVNVGQATTTVTVRIGGVMQPIAYTLGPFESTRVSYALDGGPVDVSSSDGVPIIASLRINLKSNAAYSSYTELMGLPGTTLTDTRYLFPWYNNTGLLDSQLRIANMGNAATTVRIKVQGVIQPQTYSLDPGQSTRLSLAGVDNGPLEVYSSDGVPIIAALRINLKTNAAYSSYFEFMGASVGAPLRLPRSQLSTKYWFPWYNNTGLLDSQIRFGVP